MYSFVMTKFLSELVAVCLLLLPLMVLLTVTIHWLRCRVWCEAESGVS